MRPAIRIEGLSKQYRLGSARADNNLTENLRAAAGRLARRLRPRRAAPAADAPGAFWALSDVSFEVRPGEVVGVIGRNGAGKSTLLKVLSRVVEPTAGRVELRGRIGSLLEVGTGFHPELTGRENVFLNGSILGMTRSEVKRKFDAIVEFAGVDRFLDTPVKRYSSGMYVRLAFSVAVHLEPEILIVDEVLAVGDGEFQRKCFQKMDQLRRSGRTVLVVSHNLGAVQTLCTRAVQLEQGRVVGQGDTAAEVARYLSRLAASSRQALAERTDREGTGAVRVVRVGFEGPGGAPAAQAVCGAELRVVIECEAADPTARVDYVALSCWSPDGTKVFHVDNVQRGQGLPAGGAARRYECRFPRLPLPPGAYHWNVAVSDAGTILDHVYAAATLDVLAGDFYRIGRTTAIDGGVVLIDHDWS